ncbi:MAG: hypothetical protein M3O31_15045 [Acidobacteriota bacterium]|nr:hypothetical protein [Acidobacteriota bacterium]
MSTSSIADRLLHGPHSGYIVLLIPAVILAIRSCFVDVFIGETESPPSEDAREKHGWKATKITRPIMVAEFGLMAAFAVWQMLQP